ncbi:MAG: hypothetical protein ACR2HH_00600 [Chthoniobacterales bacterium]
MKVKLLTLALGLVAFALSARGATEPSLTKIVVQVVTPNMAGEPIAANPKTIYRGGEKYARLEEKQDSLGGDQTLLVTSEPDSWVINLTQKTGRHIVDGGPKFTTSAPIFWSSSGQPEPDFLDLQFGNELQFFSKDRALALNPQTVDGKKCKALSIKTGPHEVILYLNPKTGKPLQVGLMKFGRLASTVKYLSYETNLPFKAALFKPPADISLTKAE